MPDHAIDLVKADVILNQVVAPTVKSAQIASGVLTITFDSPVKLIDGMSADLILGTVTAGTKGTSDPDPVANFAVDDAREGFTDGVQFTNTAAGSTVLKIAVKGWTGNSGDSGTSSSIVLENNVLVSATDDTMVFAGDTITVSANHVDVSTAGPHACTT